MKSVTYSRLDGSVEPEKRFDIVKVFNSDPTIDVLQLTTHGFSCQNLPNEKFSDDDIPSAPLFCGSSREIKEDAEQLPTSRAQYKPYVPYLHDFLAKNGPDASDSSSPQVKPEDNTEKKIPDQHVRSASGIESGAPSGLVPARLPTFHARYS
ncbi:uncharacterized protein LOC114282134 isoform X2 [Camellia sinensis]|uniref:uncharacterized protein LOC114282134 isoform X2 n=1 Tax=Camellia sinensis TaxID=4442 RepID=UPI0010367510|nr:uncharacterized protein LOC114282134 isoform X2 [Camellia sinensis]